MTMTMDLDTPRISVMVSCYRDTAYFEPMLESFRALFTERGDTELLICDDGSPVGGDGDTARRWAAEYPGMIRVFRNDGNRGIQYSYQRLADEARGEYLMPFDCDDLFLPFDLDAALARLDRHPEMAGSCGKKRLFSETEGDLGTSHGGDPSTFALAFNPRMVHNAMLIRRSDFEHAGGYAARYFPEPIRGPVDVSMWIALGIEKDFLFDNEFRSLYRTYPGQYSTGHLADYQEEYRRLRLQLCAAFPALWRAVAGDGEFMMSESERRLAVVLFGIDFFESAQPFDRILAKLDAAAQLLPGDYGILEYRVRTLMQQQNWSAAFGAAQQLFCNAAGRPYIQLVALDLLRKLSGDMNLPAPMFDQLRAGVTTEFFSLTPEQEKCLAAAIRK